MKKWIINVFHTSHTDIGYTDTQPRIIRNHVNYLREMISDYKKDPSKFSDWNWIAESFFIVEKFLETASKDEIETLSEMIDKKIFELSSSYLNINELANQNLYTSIQDRIHKLANSHGWKIDTLLTNDVNGYSWGYTSTLANHGIKNVYFGLHTHHGMYPLFKKQNAFYWETAEKKKLLVWVGEHYQTGNEFGLVDTHMGNYCLQSDFKEGYFPEDEQIEEGGKRMEAYLKNLEKDGYEFDNVPISVLGEATDNAPYNLTIAERVKKVNKIWGEKYGIEVKMVTLGQFFENIKNENKKIETYSGDWPDWWTDGVGSTPTEVRIFRKAQRNYELIKKLGIEDEKFYDLERDLMLFAEHTFGAWSSIENPFSFWNKEIVANKAAFASKALFQTEEIIDEHVKRGVHKLQNLNEVELVFENPYKSTQYRLIHLNEFLSNRELEKMTKGFHVKKNGVKIESFQKMTYYMKIPQPQFYCVVDFSEESKFSVFIVSDPQDSPNITRPRQLMGTDKISDYYNPELNDNITIFDNTFENDFMTMTWDEEKIHSLIIKSTGEELINSKQLHGLFTPVYELSEIPYKFESMNLHRRWTGRNRKASNAVRHVGKIYEVNLMSEDRFGTVIEFLYNVEGAKYYKVKLEIANTTNQISVNIQLLKDTEWGLENFYISLPFSKSTSKIKIDKGSMIEIWKDQLPGTTIDYYALREGFEILNPKSSVLVSSVDAPLIWTGPLEFQNRFLAHDIRNKAKPLLYSWVLNSAWETNFQANLGGFHEFNYQIYILNGKQSDENNIQELKVMNNSYLITRQIK